MKMNVSKNKTKQKKGQFKPRSPSKENRHVKRSQSMCFYFIVKGLWFIIELLLLFMY